MRGSYQRRYSAQEIAHGKGISTTGPGLHLVTNYELARRNIPEPVEPDRTEIDVVLGLLQMKHAGLLHEVHCHGSKLEVELRDSPGVKRLVGWKWAKDHVTEFRAKKNRSESDGTGNALGAATDVHSGSAADDQVAKRAAPPLADRLHRIPSPQSVGYMGRKARARAKAAAIAQRRG